MFRTASASVRSFVEEHTGHKQYSYEEIMRARGLNFYREAGLLLEPVQELKILFDHDEEAFLKEKLWSERGLKRLQRIERKAQLKENYLEDYQANILCNYLYELAGLFMSFYEHCPILTGAQTHKMSRLRLCEITARTLKTGLDLLGIDTVERM